MRVFLPACAMLVPQRPQPLLGEEGAHDHLHGERARGDEVHAARLELVEHANAKEDLKKTKEYAK